MSLFGPPDVDKLKAKGDIPGLVKALGYEKGDAVPLAAIAALVEIGPAAVKELSGTLNSPSLRIGACAVNALGQIGGPAATELLELFLQHDSLPDVRLRAALALGRIGDQRAVKSLALAAIGDEDHGVRATATKVLAAMSGDQAIELINTLTLQDERYVSADTLASACSVLGQIGGPRATGLLIADLDRHHPDGRYDGHLRKPATAALVEIGTAAIEPLTQAVASFGSEEGRAAGVEALRRLGVSEDARNTVSGAPVPANTQALEQALAKLRSLSWQVRLDAVGALGHTYSIRAVEALIACLDDGNQDVAAHAASALGWIGDSRAIGPLTELLLRGIDSYNTGDERSNYAANALAKIGASALGDLSAALRSPNRQARKCAIEALEKIGDPWAIGPLTEARTDKETGPFAAAALSRLNANTAKPAAG